MKEGMEKRVIHYIIVSLVYCRCFSKTTLTTVNIVDICLVWVPRFHLITRMVIAIGAVPHSQHSSLIVTMNSAQTMSANRITRVRSPLTNQPTAFIKLTNQPISCVLIYNV